MMFNKTEEEVIKELNTSINGLTSEEASKRLAQYGKNQLPKKKKDSVLKIFLNELKDPMIILLIFAIIASFLANEVVDGLAIFFIILVDLIMGTYQENKANNTAEALENLVTAKSKVLRDGEVIQVESTELTVGDVIVLESGDKIPADLRVIEASNLTVDESILTGESVTVNKTVEIVEKANAAVTEQTNMLFAGTSVVTGRAHAVVVGIALNTEIGKIAQSIHEAKEEKSPLTIRVEKLSKQISMLVLAVAVIIAVLLIIKQVPYNEIFLSVIALAVSAMPEGLPLALTMALTIASNKMSKQNVIVRKLKSVESLGSCTVIASDKTGTLTVNEQTAKKIVLPNNESFNITGTGYELEGVVEGIDIERAKEIALFGAINNEATIDGDKRLGDSVDIAFLVLGHKAGIDVNSVTKLAEIPYESENKYSAVFYEKDGETYCTVKGSLEKIKGFCTNINLVNDSLDSGILEKQNEEMASNGYRVIALANGKIAKSDEYNEENIKDLTFMGMVAFIDPTRKEAVSSIKECRSAGIKVLMITGDHPLTAFSIAKDLELTDSFDEVTNGEEVEKFYNEGEEAFDKFVKSKIVFTRVTPLQKLYIIESLKRQGEFVGVTGDGVNDAPALKSANIGIAMGSGTDIARETAKMIVIDDNFKSIVAGVKEGRVAYSNIRKISYFLLSCGLAEVFFFCLSIIFNMPMPLVAIQLLWLNVVTDGIQDFALSFEKGEADVMENPPRSPDEPLFDKTLFREVLLSGITIGLVVFGTWYYLVNILNYNIDTARGYIMALMVFIQNIHVFNCRSERHSALSIPITSNKIILFGVLGSVLLQVIVMEVPLLSKFLSTTSVPVLHMFYLLMVGTIIFFVVEFYKEIMNRIEDKKNKSK